MTTFKDAKVFVGNVKNDRGSPSKIRTCIATELAGTRNVRRFHYCLKTLQKVYKKC